MNAGSGNLGGENPAGGGPGLKPYLRRKKSSLGETKIAILGGEGVGKSALTVRFITKRFIGEYDQTVENKYKYSTIVDGEQMAFELLDTRSMNEDCGAREDVLKWADGYVLVYSVVSKKSFDLLSEVQKRVEEFKKGASVPIVVLANKADLAHMRQVTQDEASKSLNLDQSEILTGWNGLSQRSPRPQRSGNHYFHEHVPYGPFKKFSGQTFASTLGCPFLELSASEDVNNVTEAFTNLCRDIIEYKRRSRTFFDRVFGAFGREKVSS